MKADVVNNKGKKIKDIELNEDIFNGKVNEVLVHQVVVSEMNNKRRGNASTKTRAMVSGGGVKPWRQKGTGRARAGSNRSPLWKGGGITFGPSPKDYYTRIPKKLRKGAIKSVLSAKMKNYEIVFVDKIEMSEPKTKKGISFLNDLNIKGKTTILLTEANENIEKSFRNIPGVNVISLNKISAYNILNNKNLLMASDTVEKLTEVLS